MPTIVRLPLDTTTLDGNIRTVYTLVSVIKYPYVFGQSGTNDVVGTPPDTSTLGGNIRTVYTLISISKVSYIHGQNGTHYRWNTARHYSTTLDGKIRTVYTLVSIPSGPYISGQSGTWYYSSFFSFVISFCGLFFRFSGEINQTKLK